MPPRRATAGLEVMHGNAATAEVIEAANLPGARHLIVAIPDAFEGGQIVMQARQINPTLPIVARSHSEEETAHLKSHRRHHGHHGRARDRHGHAGRHRVRSAPPAERLFSSPITCANAIATRGLNGRHEHRPARLQRCLAGARHRRGDRAGGASLARQPGADLPGGRRRARTAGHRLVQGRLAEPAMGHHHGRQERGGHRRAGRGVPAVPDRPGAVLRAPADHAPPGVRTGQPAGGDLVGGDQHRSRHCSAARGRRPSSSACAWRCRRPRSSSSCCPSSAA